VDITYHPVFGEMESEEKVTIEFEGRILSARKGQTVASALMANGIYKLGISRKLLQGRGMFCANGRCCSCFMTINRREHVRACMTLVEEGMKLQAKAGDPDVRRAEDEC
jgi:sarcosine oxidase subunit alpha